MVKVTLKPDVLETILYPVRGNTGSAVGSPFCEDMPKGCSCPVCISIRDVRYRFFIIVAIEGSKGGSFPYLPKKDRNTRGDNYKKHVYIIETEVIVKELIK